MTIGQTPELVCRLVLTDATRTSVAKVVRQTPQTSRFQAAGGTAVNRTTDLWEIRGSDAPRRLPTIEDRHARPRRAWLSPGGLEPGYGGESAQGVGGGTSKPGVADSARSWWGRKRLINAGDEPRTYELNIDRGTPGLSFLSLAPDFLDPMATALSAHKAAAIDYCSLWTAPAGGLLARPFEGAAAALASWPQEPAGASLLEEGAERGRGLSVRNGGADAEI